MIACYFVYDKKIIECLVVVLGGELQDNEIYGRRQKHLVMCHGTRYKVSSLTTGQNDI